jgi:hypothetical protein
MAARRKILFDQIRHIQAVRAGLAPENSYVEIIGELRAQINYMDKEESVRQNWDDLKVMKRG